MHSTLVTIGRFRPDGARHLEQYAHGVLPLIQEFGGTVVTRLLPREAIVGDSEHQPSLIAVIRFPTEEQLRTFITSPRYLQHVPHRERAFAWLRSYIADEAPTA